MVVRVYSGEKTLADCFNHNRRAIGLLRGTARVKILAGILRAG
jgi:hypothetical protein